MHPLPHAVCTQVFSNTDIFHFANLALAEQLVAKSSLKYLACRMYMESSTPLLLYMHLEGILTPEWCETGFHSTSLTPFGRKKLGLCELLG